MKKIAIFIAILTVLAGCATKKTDDLVKVQHELIDYIESVYADSTLTGTAVDSLCRLKCLEVYEAHPDDSLGIDVFRMMISNFIEPQEALDLYEKATDLIKENIPVKVKIQAVQNVQKTAVGNQYTDLTGLDAITGETLTISSELQKNGKPLLIDFWASWCGPCRREIKGHLLDLATTGKVNILGIAVWEESIDDTKKAMSELGISWPVIYTEGRENSPSITYGVLSIPSLVLVDTDGTIIGRGHSIEEIDWFKSL